MLNLAQRALHLIERALEWVIALLVLGLVLIVASQLVDRHLMTLPMAAPDQYARVMLVWLTFTGFAVAVRHGANIRVDLIDARMPMRVRKVMEIVFDLVMLALTLLIGWHAWPLFRVGVDQERLGTVLSEAWLTAPLLLSCAAMAAFLLLRVTLLIAGHAAPRPASVE
jgi:TRAP-type C4-dicarboxylate transport system permease small subunit